MGWLKTYIESQKKRTGSSGSPGSAVGRGVENASKLMTDGRPIETVRRLELVSVKRREGSPVKSVASPPNAGTHLPLNGREAIIVALVVQTDSVCRADGIWVSA